MDLVVFVVFACRIFGKPALQATLSVFGLCGSCVVLVWADLWFLVTCGSCVGGSVVFGNSWQGHKCPSHVVFGCGLALDADAVDCASTCPRGRCVRLRVHLPAGLCGSVVLRVHLPSKQMPMLARRDCASTCPQGLRVRSTSCGFWLWSCPRCR